MKIKDIFAEAIELGIKNDPRGRDMVMDSLRREKEKYDRLSGFEKEVFDTDKTENPYPDSRIVYGDPELEVKKVLAGIDIETAELLLVDRINEKGAGVDLVIAHHPIGRGRASLGDVMNIHSGYMATAGVLPNIAEGIMAERISTVSRSLTVANIFRTADAAKMLNQPLVCLHTPADNMANAYVMDFLNRKQPKKVSDILSGLMEIAEYKKSAEIGAPAKILCGNSDSSAGRIYVDFTGGTEGSEENYIRLSEAGISTVVVMHASEKQLDAAKKNYMNIVLAGHISSDSLGLNLLLDEMERKGVEIIAASGLLRVCRN